MCLLRGSNWIFIYVKIKQMNKQGPPPGFVYSPAGQLARRGYASRGSCDCLTRSRGFSLFHSVLQQCWVRTQNSLSTVCFLCSPPSLVTVLSHKDKTKLKCPTSFLCYTPQKSASLHLIFFTSQRSTLPRTHLPEGRAGIAWQPSD